MKVSNLNDQIQKEIIRSEYDRIKLFIGVYQKYKTELEDEITNAVEEKSKLNLEISNLNNKIDKCVEVIKNISKYWASGSIENRIKLQKLLFPSGIVIDPVKRQYRTSKINNVFSLIASIPSGFLFEIYPKNGMSVMIFVMHFVLTHYYL